MQQHGSKCFACRPPPSPDPGVRSKGQNPTFSAYGHGAYQIKWNHKCSNMVGNILPADPSPTLPSVGDKWSKFNFSEHGHVAYQINGNDACNNMVAYILPAYPLTLACGVKRSEVNVFSTWSFCISKEMESQMQQH